MEYKHIRLYSVEGTKETKGGFSLGFVRKNTSQGGFVEVYISICSEKDIFSKKLARENLHKRLINNECFLQLELEEIKEYLLDNKATYFRGVSAITADVIIDAMDLEDVSLNTLVDILKEIILM